MIATVYINKFCAVPSEHAVISKERRSGVYHLSAYYLAKTVSELPLVLLQPSIYLIISYWIVGLNGPAAFFGTWLVLVTNSLAAQVTYSSCVYSASKVIIIFVVHMYRDLDFW